jgi:hypothetical protein
MVGMSDSTWRQYRHAKTGQLQMLHPRTARADANLIEVGLDAKPLAYVPIPSEALEKLLASTADESADSGEKDPKE